MRDRDPVLLVGLGNPGPRYARTRHNLGFLLIDRVARAAGAAVSERRFSSQFGEGRLAGRRLFLLKPQTYMNLSGRAVREALHGLRLGPADLWVAHDDLDLPLGRLRIRLQGSSGGHRGIASVIDCLGTPAFGRIRLGIGRPPAGMETAEYVLEPFAPPEWDQVDALLDRAAAAVELLLRDGPEAAMRAYNGSA